MGFPDDSAVKNSPAMQETQETWVPSLGQEDPLEEEMATPSSILTWKISWRILAGYNPQGHKELDTTEYTGALIHCWWECILEDSLSISYKIKHTITIQSSNCTP